MYSPDKLFDFAGYHQSTELKHGPTVTERLLAFDSLCGAQTGVAKCVLAFNSLGGAKMGTREHLLAFDNLWTGLVIVASNVRI